MTVAPWRHCRGLSVCRADVRGRCLGRLPCTRGHGCCVWQPSHGLIGHAHCRRGRTGSRLQPLVVRCAVAICDDIRHRIEFSSSLEGPVPLEAFKGTAVASSHGQDNMHSCCQARIVSDEWRPGPALGC